MNQRNRTLIARARALYGDPREPLPLHAPVFGETERRYVADCLESTFVSSVGAYVSRFEDVVRRYTGAADAVATVNGTAALHAALVLTGVGPGDLVLTQGLTFVATANAIRQAGAEPVFLDSDRDCLGMSPAALRAFLEARGRGRGPDLADAATGRRIAACVPVHVLGHPCRIREIAAICAERGLELVEDSAEGLGSTCGGRHVGTFGRFGTLSFNGNKIVTTGGGGMILAASEEDGRLARHMTSTARVPHPWEVVHDAAAWNYRLPNLNAALGCAQMERLAALLADKRALAQAYAGACREIGLEFLEERPGTVSNYWLCSVAFPDRPQRDAFLKEAQAAGVTARPLWRLMPDLPMYADCVQDGLRTARERVETVVSLPSGPRRASCIRDESAHDNRNTAA